MPTPAERRALLFSATLLLLGGAVRTLSAFGGPPKATAAEQADLDRQLQAVDSARSHAAKKSGKRRRPKPFIRAGAAVSQDSSTAPATIYYSVPADSAKDRASASPVDLDTAPEADIERLPWIGPVLAKRIVTDRDSLGPFGSAKGLTRVRGVGAALARKLAPYVTFSLQPRPQRVDDPGERGAARKPRRDRTRAPRSP